MTHIDVTGTQWDVKDSGVGIDASFFLPPQVIAPFIMCGGITCPCPNFNGATVYIWEWIINPRSWVSPIVDYYLLLNFVLTGEIFQMCDLSTIVYCNHFSDVIMGTMASQITSLTIVYSTVYSGPDLAKYQGSASLSVPLLTRGENICSSF